MLCSFACCAVYIYVLCMFVIFKDCHRQRSIAAGDGRIKVMCSLTSVKLTFQP
jgi:hypothetical protein